MPDFNTNMPDFNTNMPHFNTNMPDFNTNIPHFNTNMLDFNTNMPHFNTNMPHFNTDMPHFNTNITHFNTISLCGTFCGLCLACQVSQDMQESVCVPCFVPTAVAMLRTKWRTQYNIQGSILEDCLLDHFCGPCSLCQLAREVKLTKQMA
ncbi:hypothetical protein EGW08_017912 [Elysia chlorotica]|uniref:Uncharacterized protein n=1 Tax=Elysia chlorotica TaxID=188477 RepID=A0A433SYD2_ELYCH|nr:hypothetical protein EGW08_017912 [Elysia chlorotica]